MKIKRPSKNGHVESGTYEVEIIDASVRDSKGRQQLVMTLAVGDSGPYFGFTFFHAIMLEGTSDFFLNRFFDAVAPVSESTADEIDTEHLIGKKLIMELESKCRGDLYPNVKDVRRRISGN